MMRVSRPSLLPWWAMMFLTTTLLSSLSGTMILRPVQGRPYDAHPPNPPSELTVGAYYYPWWYQHFQISREGYMRRDLQPRQDIRLGHYDDRNPAVLTQHLEWARQANIGMFVSSWWGPNKREDDFLKNLVFTSASSPVPNLGDFPFAILYETTGRIKESTGWDVSINVPSDFEYICQTQNYISHPNYYKIDGRPVILIYLTRKLETEQVLDDLLRIIREKCGGDSVYIIGDHMWDLPPDKTLDDLDAITNYDWYGNVGRPRYAGQSKVDAYYQEAASWKAYAATHQAHFIPAVTPGFNDRGVRLQVDHPAMSRKLDAESEEGSLLAAQLVQAIPLIDPGAGNLMLVNSFNEWHEDTQIEPCDGITTTDPVEYTQGLEYVGYGDLYLNILATYTSTTLTPKSNLPIVYTGPPTARNLQTGAFYWSWHTEANFQQGVRANLEPTPQTSNFSLTSDPIRQDLWVSWKGNVKLWITPWSRPDNANIFGKDHATEIGASKVFEDAYLQGVPEHKVAIHYYLKDRVSTSGDVYNDIVHLADNYFGHPNYYKTARYGKPVLFLGLTRALTDTVLEQAVADIRDAAASKGWELYLVGDEVWRDAPTSTYLPFSLLDAVMNQDVYGNMRESPGYVTSDTLDAFFEEQRQWRVAALAQGCSYIPMVIPGFNNRGVSPDNHVIARKLNPTDSADGTLFAASLDKAQYLVDSELDDLILINSLNHFTEDTQIYPVYGPTSNSPESLTQGYDHVGYGELYLDLLAERFGTFEIPPTESPSAMPSSGPTPAPVLITWETIFLDDFEDGFVHFESLGKETKIDTKVVYNGKSALVIKDDKDTSMAVASDLVVEEYISLRASFFFYADGADSGADTFYLEWSIDGGNTWNFVRTYTAGTDFDDKTWTEATETWATGDASVVSIRLRSGFNDGKEKIYFDDVHLEGMLDVPEPPTAAPQAKPSEWPSSTPSATPTVSPSTSPTARPSQSPSTSPSGIPTLPPVVPTGAPSGSPSVGPTKSSSPSASPTSSPTVSPSWNPSTAPTSSPSVSPTAHPSGMPSNAPTAPPVLASWETLFIEDFESGFTYFESGGGKETKIQNKQSYQGENALQIKDDKDTSMTTAGPIGVSMYTSLHIHFFFYAENADAGESFYVEWSSNGGSNWNLLKRFIATDDFDDKTWTEGSHTWTVADDIDQVYIRIRSGFNDGKEKLSLDEIHLEGLAGTPAV